MGPRPARVPRACHLKRRLPAERSTNPTRGIGRFSPVAYDERCPTDVPRARRRALLPSPSDEGAEERPTVQGLCRCHTSAVRSETPRSYCCRRNYRGVVVEPRVRAIQYEICPRERALEIGVSAATLDRHLEDVSEIAPLRCVNRQGEKLTAVGRADRVRELLRSGQAGDPTGMLLAPEAFPVVVYGWKQAG
jgi:hypothetical protein